MGNADWKGYLSKKFDYPKKMEKKVFKEKVRRRMKQGLPSGSSRSRIGTLGLEAYGANDLTASIDISVLQERLTNMINLASPLPSLVGDQPSPVPKPVKSSILSLPSPSPRRRDLRATEIRPHSARLRPRLKSLQTLFPHPATEIRPPLTQSRHLGTEIPSLWFAHSEHIRTCAYECANQRLGISVPRCRDCVNGGRISVAGCGNSVWRDFSRGRRRAECGRISVSRRSRRLGEGGGRERMEDLTGLGAGEGRSPAREGRGLARAHGREEPWRVK
ncbi:Uncharacterized protein Fot_13718 [Forsythia ovata]|uniref:Uncharacterized protein n=1 Tax=Forsythia ovata TaxID=205694 RepID=A0ABD1W491_9LAMI